MLITMFNLDRPVAEKPHNKRTAKGLILSGANGKRARRDARGMRSNGMRDACTCFGPKATISRNSAIMEQLDEGTDESHDDIPDVSGLPPYSVESENFIPKMGRSPKGVVSSLDVIDTETGLPLIVIDDTDASQFCEQFHEDQLLSVGTLADPDSEEPWL